MSNIIRSVRRLMPTNEPAEVVHDSNGNTEHYSEATSEFRSIEKPDSATNPNRMFRSRSWRPADEAVDMSYIQAPGVKKVAPPALSPTSPSSANSRYQLMDEVQDEDGAVVVDRDGPPSTEPERIQQSFHRVQRRVSDSFRNLQGSVSRRLANTTATTTTVRSHSEPGLASAKAAYLLTSTLHDDNDHNDNDNEDDDYHRRSEARDEMEETISDKARFLRKAVKGIRKSWSFRNAGGGMDDDFSPQASDGYIRHAKDESVIFAPMKKDMVLA